MRCSDHFLDYLKNYGYNAMRLPKGDVKPLQIFAERSGELYRLGELRSLMSADPQVAFPTNHTGTPVANISGQKTSDLSIGVGLSILGPIIGAMGGSSLGLAVAYSQARTITFEIHDVVEEHVDLIDLDKFLAQADVDPTAHHVGSLLEKDEVYVTSSTLKSKRFSVEGKKKDGSGLELKVPEVKGIVGGNIAVSAVAEVTSNITYEGGVPLVFGFQAVRLFYEDGKYHALKPASGVGMRASGQDEGDRFQAAGPFVTLHLE